MTVELFWLILTVAMTAVLWVPYIINRIIEHGLLPALRNPKPDEPPKAGWANRLMQAHSNAVENLVVFAPLVLILNFMGVSSDATIAAAVIYFWARLAHVIIYTFGIPYLRTVAFFTAFVAQCVLIYSALTM
ncbi:MAG: putative MAPEG superfamily protein [Pseudohongiellaceae bacterium]|jgi:uncharacterized MAPEG superfamily protein